MDTTVALELPPAAGLIRSNLIKITLGLTFLGGKFDTVSTGNVASVALHFVNCSSALLLCLLRILVLEMSCPVQTIQRDGRSTFA